MAKVARTNDSQRVLTLDSRNRLDALLLSSASHLAPEDVVRALTWSSTSRDRLVDPLPQLKIALRDLLAKFIGAPEELFANAKRHRDWDLTYLMNLLPIKRFEGEDHVHRYRYPGQHLHFIEVEHIPRPRQSEWARIFLGDAEATSACGINIATAHVYQPAMEQENVRIAAIALDAAAALPDIRLMSNACAAIARSTPGPTLNKLGYCVRYGLSGAVMQIHNANLDVSGAILTAKSFDGEDFDAVTESSEIRRQLHLPLFFLAALLSHTNIVRDYFKWEKMFFCDGESFVNRSDIPQVCFYLPLHFKRILLTILTCPPHILTF